MLRIMLTNDDGIDAPGIRALADRLSQRAQLLVVAPERQSSAKSHSITLHKPLRLFPVDGYPGPPAGNGSEAFACSGTPADCAMLGLLHQYKDNLPDIVVSGINSGENVAQDLAYSGTVGGALEGAINGVPSVAVSLVGTRHASYGLAAMYVELLLAAIGGLGAGDDAAALCQHWDGATAAADKVEYVSLNGEAHRSGTCIAQLPDWPPVGLAHTLCLNMNVPDLPSAKVKGFALARPGHRDYIDVVQIGHDPRGREYFWIGGERVDYDDEQPGADTHALLKGYIPLTPVSYDLAGHHDLCILCDWFGERAAR